MNHPISASLAQSLRSLASAETETVTCSRCGTSAQHPAQMPGRPAHWRDTALCASCARTAGRAAALTSLHDDARTTWAARVHAFDRLADYTKATLGTEGRPAAVDNRLTNAITDWDHTARAVGAESTTQVYRGGFVLFGPIGVGKTRAGFAVLNALADRVNPGTLEFGTEQALLGSVTPWDAPQAMARLLDGCEALLLDDVGVASYASVDARLVIWRAFADALAHHDRRLLLIITTNRLGWDVADATTEHATLTDWIGPQVASRVRQIVVMMPVGYTDHRTGVVHTKFKTMVENKSRR